MQLDLSTQICLPPDMALPIFQLGLQNSITYWWYDELPYVRNYLFRPRISPAPPSTAPSSVVLRPIKWQRRSSPDPRGASPPPPAIVRRRPPRRGDVDAPPPLLVAAVARRRASDEPPPGTKTTASPPHPPHSDDAVLRSPKFTTSGVALGGSDDSLCRLRHRRHRRRR